MPTSNKIRIYSEKIARTEKLAQRETLQDLENKKKKLLKQLELVEIQTEITKFYVTAKILEDQHSGINFLIATLHSIYRDRMIRDQERLSSQLIGFPQQPISASPSVVGEDDNSTEVSSLGSVHSGSARNTGGSSTSFGIRGSELGEDEFDEEELANVDLSFYRT